MKSFASLVLATVTTVALSTYATGAFAQNLCLNTTDGFLHGQAISQVTTLANGDTVIAVDSSAVRFGASGVYTIDVSEGGRWRYSGRFNDIATHRVHYCRWDSVVSLPVVSNTGSTCIQGVCDAGLTCTLSVCTIPAAAESSGDPDSAE